MMRGLENLTSEDGWRDLGLFSLKSRAFFLMWSYVGYNKNATKEEIIVSLCPRYIKKEVNELKFQNDLFTLGRLSDKK